MYNKLDVNKLIMHKSIIHHILYDDGIFIRHMHNIIYVQFNHEIRLFNIADYQKTWYVKNYSGYQIDGSKVLDSSRDFENTFLNSTISQIVDELNEIENEINNLPDMGYDSNMNNVAKQKGILQAKKSSLSKMQWHPYFARIDLVESNNVENGVSYYITGNKDNQKLDDYSVIELDNIVDWRSEEASPYYDQEMYSNDEAENKLVLLRDYEIKNKELVSFSDNLTSDKELIEQVADERLKKHIESNRNNHIKNIIQTIKTNQYRIISHNQNRNILVQGCAGSGKTMILAHRLTFWLFRLKGNLDIKDTYIVSPTKLLSYEMTKLDLNIREANFMSNFEFNKYLIDYISNELDVHAYLADNYLSNNCIDNSIIKDAYSSRIISDYKNLIGILEEKEDEDIYNDFIEYTKHLLNKEYNTLYDTKKDITLEEQKNHEEVYSKVCQLLSNISFIDVSNFEAVLNKENSHLIETENQIKKINKQIKEMKKVYKQQLDKVSQVHEEFHDKNFFEVKKLLEDWNDDITLAEDEYKDVTNLIEKFKNDISLYLLFKVEKDEIEDKISKASFFARRSLEKQKQSILFQLELAAKEIEDEYSKYNLNINSNINEIEERIAIYKSVINEERTLYNYLYGVTLDYIELLNTKKNYDEIYSNYEDDNLDVNKKYIKLASQLLQFSRHLSQDKHSDDEVKAIFNKLINIKVPNNRDLISFIKNMDSYYNLDQYKYIEDYIENGESQPVIMLITDFVIDQFKQDYRIDSNHYEFELFLKLYFLYDRDNIRKIQNKWIFIDEFQDYSYWEIEIYRSIFAKSSFNYFGDMKQNINAKGLGTRELEILTNKKFDKFEIPENYRNAKEITDYVNDRMNLRMYPIGLEGKVIECTLDVFFDSISKYKDSCTIAIVISNEIQKNILKRYEMRYPLYFVDENDITIASDKINVLTPLLIKGLEFDTVCVLEYEMTENEKYVSFTRALTELYVIKEVV